MLLKGSLSEPDWLSKANPLSEEARSLSERKTQKNVKLESSALSTQPTRPAKLLSLLALRASKPAKGPVRTSNLSLGLLEAHARCLSLPQCKALRD
ncbi:hypothetical protein JHK86_001683 [Glycine max]|nr:hypothetical protein JHK86_001683 [Glycine max]